VSKPELPVAAPREVVRRISRTALWEQAGYAPHPGQVGFHESPARYKVAACGRRWGKSMAAAMEIAELLFATHSDGTGTRSWIIGPTYKTGAKEFEYLWNATVGGGGVCAGLKGIRKAFNARTGEMFIEMPWGSRVEVKSADHPDGLVSEGLDYALFSEAAKQDPRAWEKYVEPALADWHGKAIFPSTPEGLNWFYRAYQRGADSASPQHRDWASFHLPSWTNPIVYPDGFFDTEIQKQIRDVGPLEQYERALAVASEAGMDPFGDLTDCDDPVWLDWLSYIRNSPSNAWFWQEIGAEFHSFVGQVYPEWDDEVHVIDNYTFNPEWPNYAGVDFGFRNPFACIEVQVAPDDTLIVWREYYEREKPTHIHARELGLRENPPGYHIDQAFADCADASGIETLGMLWAPTVGLGDAKKNPQEGIDAVKEFLALRDVYDPQTGETKRLPRLVVVRDCPNTIWEFNNYRTKENRKEEENAKEEPRKFADHALDAIRYLVMHLFKLGARYSLADVVFGDDNPSQGAGTSIADLGRTHSDAAAVLAGIDGRREGEPLFTSDSASLFRL
jgi:hypothetical protein